MMVLSLDNKEIGERVRKMLLEKVLRRSQLHLNFKIQKEKMSIYQVYPGSSWVFVTLSIVHVFLSFCKNVIQLISNI